MPDTWLRGDGGILMAGCRIAARLGTWSLVGGPHEYRVSGRVVWSDPFWVARGPDIVSVPVDGGSWTWETAAATFGADGRVEVAMTGEPTIRA